MQKNLDEIRRPAISWWADSENGLSVCCLAARKRSHRSKRKQRTETRLAHLRLIGSNDDIETGRVGKNRDRA
jgi:hypothetical protein